MKMDNADLASLLRRIAIHIEAGDSFEGRISYSFGEVDAFLRVGNLEGQGRAIVVCPSPKEDETGYGCKCVPDLEVAGDGLCVECLKRGLVRAVLTTRPG